MHTKQLIVALLLALACFTANAAESNPKKAYNGYDVDGRTSASVLTAKRSHAVSRSDELGLGLVSGLFAIGAIAFAVRLLKSP